LDTNRVFEVAESKASLKNEPYAVRYEPTKLGFLDRVLPQLSIEYERFVFVDLGSGKGRALMEATTYPFKRIIGVEFVPELHQSAQLAVRRYQNKTGRGHNIDLLCLDACHFEIPTQDVILYFYNPFTEKVMAQVLANLEASLRSQWRHAVIVYLNSVCAHLMDRLHFLRLVEQGRYGRDPYRVYTNYGLRIE